MIWSEGFGNEMVTDRQSWLHCKVMNGKNFEEKWTYVDLKKNQLVGAGPVNENAKQFSSKTKQNHDLLSVDMAEIRCCMPWNCRA